MAYNNLRLYDFEALVPTMAIILPSCPRLPAAERFQAARRNVTRRNPQVFIILALNRVQCRR